MPNETMLPQQANAPPDANQADVPSNAQVFGITNLGFTNFDELLKKSAQELGIEFEIFFSNSAGTQHGLMRIKNGRVSKTIPLLEICVLSSSPVILAGTTEGYLIRFYLTRGERVFETFAATKTLEKHQLCEALKIPPHGSKSRTALCERLLETLILSKAETSPPITIGLKQGWRVRTPSCAVWEAVDNYSLSLKDILPRSIVVRSKPRIRHSLIYNREHYHSAIEKYFALMPELKLLFLIRIASYLLTFAANFKLFWDQIIAIKPTEKVGSNLIAAALDNVGYRNKHDLHLSEMKRLRTASNLLSDAVMLVFDDTRIDDHHGADGRAQLEKMVTGCDIVYPKIPIVISEKGASLFEPGKVCEFNVFGTFEFLSPAILAEILEWHDATFLEAIEQNYSKFFECFSQNINEIVDQAPGAIPVHRRNVATILLAALRTYDEYFGVFFDDETELKLIDILSAYKDVGSSNDELLLSVFGKCLNDEIDSGRFKLIKRAKYIVFDEGTDTIIIDEDNIYIETSVIKELALSKMKLHSINSLTDALKANECLNINDHNSKCYRFHVQNSNGEPYMLYTYGISKQLINAENRKRLELADYQKYLLEYGELSQNELLPLGITADGRYVGKDISFGNKSNDHILITGQSGRGKSFCATNLLPLLAMLGSRMLVCDVSDSFTRDEVLRALPADVVDAMFEFIEVAAGKRKLPINPLFIGDCPGLPAKKRRIVGFIKAIAGKLDKEETRELTGIVSEMLKRYPKESSVTTDMIRNTLKRGGKTSRHVFSLISSTLDDIDTIGFEECGWAEFFEKSKKIPVISFGNESGDKVHSVLDAMISSAFEWQRDHDSAPLSIVIDEIKDQNFAEESPLHTILTQGRKFHTRFIGMTQHYVSTTSHAIDVVKEAGIKIFFRPSKSLDRIATELGYRNPADAGFGSMGIGDIILCAELFNKVDGVNEPVVLHAKAIKFVDTPLFEQFKKEYDIK